MRWHDEAFLPCVVEFCRVLLQTFQTSQARPWPRPCSCLSSAPRSERGSWTTTAEHRQTHKWPHRHTHTQTDRQKDTQSLCISTQLRLSASGVTRDGVTRGGNWWVSPTFYKNLTTFFYFFSHRLWKWWPFSCHLLTTPIFPRRLSSVLFQIQPQKINFRAGVTRGGRLSDVFSGDSVHKCRTPYKHKNCPSH